MYSATLSLTSALDGVGGQPQAPTALPPGKRPGIHCIGGSVGPRAGRDGCGKSRHPPGFDHLTFQPVESCTATIHVVWGLFPQHLHIGSVLGGDKFRSLLRGVLYVVGC